jgi:CRISPR/Cas system Type II protein with McrA/HNH and RuvC-like nuclease domain
VRKKSDRATLKAAIKALTRRSLFNDNGGACRYCDQKLTLQTGNHKDFATIDHVIPKSDGGSDDYHNLTIACKSCNEQKGSLSVEEFLLVRMIKENNLNTRLAMDLPIESPESKTVTRVREKLTYRYIQASHPSINWRASRLGHW